MAIIKHASSKNADYSDVLGYFTQKHKENLDTGHYEPILDEYGLTQERENYAVVCLTAYGNEAAPEHWAVACEHTNRAFDKNNKFGEVRQHQYIICHPAEDRPKMTMDDLLKEGKAFVRENLHGYDALIAVHRDTDCDHIHIAINSVRTFQREEEPWMVRNDDGTVKLCEMRAGGKHQDSAGFRRHINDWLLDYTRRHDLTEKDNNAISDKRKAERRLHPESPDSIILSRRERELREALLKEIPQSGGFGELQNRLREGYGILLKRSGTGKTVSLRHPESMKPVRLDRLGLDMDIFRFPAQEQLPGIPEEHSAAEPIPGNTDAGEGSPFEKKPYIFWVENRREKNSEKAESILAQAKAIILNQEEASQGKKPRRVNVKKLDALLRKSEYAERDLRCEAEKLDGILARWDKYKDPATPDAERREHESYLRWCGADPDSVCQQSGWQTARENIDCQIDGLISIREPLRQIKFSIPKDYYCEEKSYNAFMKECRLKNAEKAEETIARSEAVVARRIRAQGAYYSYADFRELNYLIQRTTYVERDLRTEAEKLDNILERWGKYQDPAAPPAERQRHGDFIRWCGCDPDCAPELEYQRIQRQIIDVQIRHITAVRDALLETAESWRNLNDTPESKLSWTIDRERELRAQLKTVRANRLKLGEIAYNCQQAVKHRVNKGPALEKAEYYRGQWLTALQKEKTIQEKLRDVKRQKWDARRQSWAAADRLR